MNLVEQRRRGFNFRALLLLVAVLLAAFLPLLTIASAQLPRISHRICPTDSGNLVSFTSFAICHPSDRIAPPSSGAQTHSPSSNEQYNPPTVANVLLDSVKGFVESVSELNFLFDMGCVQMEPAVPSWLLRFFACPGGQASAVELSASNEKKREDCVFCGIVNGTVESTIVYQVVAFMDIHPSAEYHFQVIPRDHVASVKALTINDIPLLEHMQSVGKQLLESHGKDIQKQRFGFHVPPFTSINHLHMHTLGLPFKNWVRAVKYPDRWHWARWFIEAERMRKSMVGARDRGVAGNATWNWSWVK
ncbi:HIT-like domain-containing protein [Cladochytrium replicatum]|nr:HIT-like domain-containing protein [Cladochytrium replicatum]